jgi:hypothetical protein
VFGVPGGRQSPASAASDPVETVVERDTAGGQFVYVVFHTLDRGGFCNPPTGPVSLHPAVGIPVEFLIETGDGAIIETSVGPIGAARSASAVPTFSTAVNAASASPVRAFPPLVKNVTDECQAWVKISQSIPGPLRVLVTVAGADGNDIRFIADLARTQTYEVTLNFRWSLVTWRGADGVPPADALKDAGAANGGSDIASEVTALYAWNAAAQSWQAYFPAGAGVPGANDLVSLKSGEALWIAIRGPNAVIWSIAAAPAN